MPSTGCGERGAESSGEAKGLDSAITSLELMDRAVELDLAGPGFFYKTSPGTDTRTYAIMSGDGSLTIAYCECLLNAEREVYFMIKLLRAQGECLGTKRR